MKHFSWVVDVKHGADVFFDGLQDSVLVPESQMNGLEQQLGGSYLWILPSSVECRVASVLYVIGVEQFLDGPNVGVFFVSVDLSRSILLSREYDGAPVAPDVLVSGLKHGVSFVDRSAQDALREVIDSRVQVRLVEPRLSGRHLDVESGFNADAEGIAVAAIRSVVCAYALEELWTWSKEPDLMPVATFAAHALRAQGIELQSSRLRSLIKAFDPVHLLFEYEGDVPGDQGSDGIGRLEVERFVDVTLRVIDPAMVYSRQFVCSTQLTFDRSSALAKTQLAERLHQEMVRDVAEYLLKVGMIPLESRSVDLAFRLNGRLRVIEVKSVTSANLFSQIAEGAFQVSYYRAALSFEEKAVDALLLVSDIQVGRVLETIRRTLGDMNVGLLVYCPSRPWPYRVSGLLGPVGEGQLPANAGC